MPDALLLTRNNKYASEIRELIILNNLRLKFTFEDELAREWLKTRAFDILLLPANVTFEMQEESALALWQRNPRGIVILYDAEDKLGYNSKKVRLMGAHLATGERYLEIIERQISKIPMQPIKSRREYKILVVEDLDAARDIICSFVENLGFSSVSGVCSAKEALAILDGGTQTVDCIITDERMPEMKGHELIAHLRASGKNKDMPLIVLTAQATQDCLLQALEVGASGFLVKPPSKENLLRETARAMRISAGLEKARLVEPEQAKELIDLL